ncbi:hypothetical protein SLEP1_g1973 [Rubroshorea leprosula]|uniref:Uncharacterized protein n=1 Tax=Rubroshorea leprosula TaxID=152421 RepID=A0AAV5HMS2_9ROSI|nr:hypothetical protein SLEP1_g1973 [Rubroshorea leprosula]
MAADDGSKIFDISSGMLSKFLVSCHMDVYNVSVISKPKPCLSYHGT